MPYLGNAPAEAYSNIAYQDFGTQSGTTFTLDFPAGAPGELEVFVNNVRQEPSVAYTVSGTTLTMTGTVAASDDFYVVFQGKAQQTVTHPANTALAATTGTFSGALTATTGTFSGALTATTGTFSDAVSMGANNITFSNGNGIDFSATAGSGATSSILDDYEEGTWTPSIGGDATYGTVNHGRYTKIGNIVSLNFTLQVNLKGTGSNALLSGLPFTSADVAWVQTGCVSYYTDLATATNFIALYVNNNSTTISFVGNNGNNTTIALNGFASIGNSTLLTCSVTYRVA